MAFSYYGTTFYTHRDLSHHGILGQKWGVRRFQNKDGTLTEAGKKRYLSSEQVSGIQETYKYSKYNEDISDRVFSIAGADKSALYAARNELQKNLEREREVTKEFDEMFKELNSDEGARVYYMATSEIAAFDNWKPIDDLTVRDMADAAFMGVFEDGGQSNINEYSMYAYKHGLEDKCDSLLSSSYEAGKESREAAEKYVQTALNAVGGESLTMVPNNPNFSAANALVRRMIYSDYDSWNDTHGSYLLEAAAHAKSFTQANKDAIAKAEKLAAHVANPRDDSEMLSNTWFLLSEASDNLGLSGVKASELSQADWDRINAEIRRLRKF